MLRKTFTTAIEASLQLRGDARQGALLGIIHVSVKVGGVRSTHEWQSSIDGKTWVDMPPTMQGKTTATGFTPGTTVYFRHRTLTKSGLSDWSQPISVMAH